MHRGDLCEKLKSIYPTSLWIVALYWNIETVSEKEILEFSRDRIEKRGENHQNLTPGKAANYPHIVKMFLNNYQTLDVNDVGDNLIDEVVEVQFKEDSLSIVKKLINALELEPKTDEELQKAYKEALEYKPEIIAKPKYVAPIYYGLRMKYFDCKDFVVKVLEKSKEQNEQYTKDYEKVKFNVDNSNFLQREHVTMAFRKRDTKEKITYYDTLTKSSDQIAHFNDPELEVFVHVSSIVWTNNLVFIPVDTIESDKIYQEPVEEGDGNEGEKKTNKDIRSCEDESLYHITVACYGDARPVECRFVLQNVNKYYEEHQDMKPAPSSNENLTVVDENYCIDDSNKDEKETIVHPSTITQLLPPTIKDTSFIKITKYVEGPDWKQIFFEPFKFKAYYTKFFY